MRWRVATLGVLIVSCWTLLSATSVSATTLKISPLRYDASLEKGEKKKGFVDITNPTDNVVKITLSVQAFRQKDDAGTLEFYDSSAVQEGVLLDYSEVELLARESFHLAFRIDGSKLPSGDNFAALFAATVPDTNGAGEQTIKVGTLLIISNATPSAHEAVIENLNGSLLQFSDALRLSFGVRNTADASMATGFSPTITVRAWPYIHDTVNGPLVFAGRTRQVEYAKTGSYLGILAVTVATGDSSQTMYRLAVTGYWRVIVPLVAALIVLIVWITQLARKHYSTSGKATPSDD